MQVFDDIQANSRSGASRCSAARCPECDSLRVMTDAGICGVCNECGFAWDYRPHHLDKCGCGHYYHQHDATNDECGAFINEYIGDCSCERFKKA